MSRETMTHLNTQTLIGYTEKRGNAWHYRADLQGDEPNHYTGAVPVEDVRRRLLNWKPVSGEITSTIFDENGVTVITDDTRQAIVRPDTKAVLGVFKSGYQIHDYDQWLIENVETILDADLAIGSAGLLKGGAQAWVQVEMEDTLEVCGVEYRPFLTAATSLDGSLATTYQMGSQVVVCDNTLSAALGAKDADRIKIRHSSKSLGRIGEVRDALQIVHEVGDEFAAAVEALCNEVVSEERFEKWVDAYTGRNKDGDSKRAATLAQTKADALTRLWHHDERVAPWAGTAYGVVAAANTYAHHEANVRGTDRATRNTERMVTGKVDALDATTLKFLAAV